MECTYHALQCFGGHGYIAEHGMEQLARDARITTLYEGTTGIQALDLLGRKVLQQQGAGLKVMLDLIEAFCESADHARRGQGLRRRPCARSAPNGSSSRCASASARPAIPKKSAPPRTTT